MRRTNARWTWAVVACLTSMLIGCGGSSESEPEYAPIAAAPSASPVPAQVPAAPGAPAAAVAPPAAAAPDLAAAGVAPGTAAPAASEPSGAGSSLQRKSPDAAATDDLLALAKAAPVAGPPTSGSETAAAGTEPGAQAPGANRPPGYGAMGSGGGMPANYPGMSGSQGGGDYQARSSGGAGGAAGYPGAGGPGYPGRGQAGAAGGGSGYGPGGVGGPSGAGGSSITADYSNPIKGAETFLAAVEARDAFMLNDSVALRASQEASPKTKPYFIRILEGPQSIDEELLNLFEDAVGGMQIAGTNRVNSTARLGVIVSKQNEDGDEIRRTITMRKEKAGWKVADISGPAIIKAPAFSRGRNQGQGSPAAGGAGRSGGAGSSGGGGASGFDR